MNVDSLSLGHPRILSHIILPPNDEVEEQGGGPVLRRSVLDPRPQFEHLSPGLVYCLSPFLVSRGLEVRGSGVVPL